MRITVKIGDIEITIDRPDFKEERFGELEDRTMKTVVIPSIAEATKKATELFNLRNQ